MSTNERHLKATPGQVWQILADGWTYPLWVVGASRMRQVEAGWPRPQARLHHSAGAWPLLVNDTTTALECQPQQHLQVKARGWPMGEVTVDIYLEEQARGTRVRLEETVTSGPALLIPSALRNRALQWRNTETLRRLAFLAERAQDA